MVSEKKSEEKNVYHGPISSIKSRKPRVYQ
jgi:hypothetical protein